MTGDKWLSIVEQKSENNAIIEAHWREKENDNVLFEMSGAKSENKICAAKSKAKPDAVLLHVRLFRIQIN